MDKQTAANLVTQTFNAPFDQGRFANFARNLFNQIDESKAFSQQGAYIWDAFKDHVRQYKRLGTYTDPEGTEIDILIVRLKKETALSRARTMQRNFVARYLRERGEKDAAIVAYYTDGQPDWRFSLVKMEYQIHHSEETGRLKVKEALTPARRYSFLVGQDEPNHTAQQQLVPVLQDTRHNPTLAQLEAAFNIESVTKEFFQKYKDLFLDLKDELGRLTRKEKAVKIEFDRAGIETANFAKKLLGQIVFLYFLQKKGWLGVAQGQAWGSGPKDFLRRLFEKRGVAYTNFFNDVLEPLFYEALAIERPGNVYSRLNCRIPFLNGGLFEPVGDYDWQTVDILLNNARFRDIFKTFDLFNFTVRENEPLEKEVAVDPEMLGKVFEKLLDVTERKSKGAFYTPREIVHYMCQESLINYLDTKIEPISRVDIDAFIRKGELGMEHDAAKAGGTKSYQYQIPQTIRANAAALDAALADIKICDPAIGSGAFPVSFMQEIVKARTVLTTYLSPPSPPPKEGEDLLPLPVGEGWGEGRSSYAFKRHAIQESIYGVDIDPGAVDIAKLRLWLSLVVDEDSYDQIQPLPNLDYKIVCGNALLGVEKDLFNHHLFEEIEQLKPIFFAATDPAEKRTLKNKIDGLIAQLTHGNRQFDFEIYFSEVFHHNGGFDVVIGNPPYVSHDKLKNKKYLKRHYKSYEPFADLYCYFLEKSIINQNRTGTLCFITSNSYMKSEYGKPLRKFISQENNVVNIVNVEDFQLFETAVVNSAILLSQRKTKSEQPDAWIVNSIFDGKVDFENFVLKNRFKYPQREFANEYWILVPRRLLRIKKKIEKAGKTLEHLGAKIRLGLATGANYAFIIDEQRRQQLLASDGKNAEIIKPILRGRDIFRYQYKQPNLYILLTKNGINVKQQYPKVYLYLDSFGEKLKKRGAKGRHWTNLRACSFFDDFKLEQIVWIELTDKGRFTLSSEEIYLINTAYFMLPPVGFSAKYLLGILNSKLIQFYLGLIAETSGMGTTRWINNYIKKFPIPEPSTSNPIEALVTQILAAKQANPTTDTTALEAEIDRLVYQLYGLKAEEIAIVEGHSG